MSNEKSGIPSAPAPEDVQRVNEQRQEQGNLYPTVNTNLPPSYDEAIKEPSHHPGMPNNPVPPYPQSPEGYIPTDVGPGYTPMVQNLHPLPQSGPASVTVIRSVITNCCFGKHPVQTRCPHCFRDITTKTMETNGRRTWCIFFAIFLLGFFIPIAWCCLCLPFCSSDCQDVLHLCPHCKSVVGHYKRDI
uniref:LITAF domain-containing protein n=1 Tax=Strongyloides venezuelensis TaxID=75913 RepID=A0A0K0FB08_STRVS